MVPVVAVMVMMMAVAIVEATLAGGARRRADDPQRRFVGRLPRLDLFGAGFALGVEPRLLDSSGLTTADDLTPLGGGPRELPWIERSEWSEWRWSDGVDVRRIGDRLE